MKNNPLCKETCRYPSIHYLLGKPRIDCGRLNTCKFVCATMSCASLSMPLSDDLSDILGVARSRISHPVLMVYVECLDEPCVTFILLTESL